MAIIYSYPPNSNILATDIIIGTTTALVGGKPKNQTKSFSIENLTNYIGSQVNITLNDVLVNGNYSLLFANVGRLGLFDIVENDYALLDINDSYLIFEDINGRATAQHRRGIDFQGDGVNGGSIYLPVYGASYEYFLPDESGTIALINDLPSTINQVPKLNGRSLVASSIYDDGLSVGIGTVAPKSCAKLQVDSTTQGFLPPRMNTADINAIVEPADGLIVYNGETYQFYGFTGGVWKTFRMDTI